MEQINNEASKRKQLADIINDAVGRGILTKAVFSKSGDPDTVKAVCTLYTDKNGEELFQTERFASDGKAFHSAVKAGDAGEEAERLISAFSFKACEVITDRGNCSVLISKKGARHIVDRIGKGSVASSSADRAPAERSQAGHDRAKKHLLPEDAPFLASLGLSDGKKVFDRARAKYRQINRFTEIVDEVYHLLPAEGPLTVCDLCCGKSYLSFAVYWYLTVLKGRETVMYCVDRKADVMKTCAEAAEKLGYSSMFFTAGDVALFSPPRRPDLTLSLHACDIATDLVLAFAIRNRSKLILSTPCCHHELFHQIGSLDGALSPLSRHSMMKQKLTDALTDSLRCELLEASGYDTDAIELIDPEETPKNILIRAVFNERKIKNAQSHIDAYKNCCALFGVEPTLGKLLDI